MTYDEKVAKIPVMQELLNRAQMKLSTAATTANTGMTVAAYPETQEVDAVVAADIGKEGFLYIAKMKDMLTAILTD